MRRILVVALAMFAASGCKGEEVAANVNCKVSEQMTVDCSVVQTKGKSEMNVCWDFHVECPNGATLKAERTCAAVKDGGTTTVTITEDKITVEGACEGELKATLTNLTYNGKKSD